MRIVVLGCGNMAQAILLGAYKQLGNGLEAYCYTPSHSRAKELSEKIHGVHIKDLSELTDIEDVDSYLIACKPQSVSELATSLKGIISPNMHIISILAGTEISTLKKLFYTERVTRVMPSTPTFVGEGISLVCHSQEITNENIYIEKLFGQTSDVIPMENEEQLDMVTTVSGCGPAYVFNFSNALALSLTDRGIDAKLADRVVRKLLLGAAKLMAEKNDLSFQELQNQVTSKGGITAEAIRKFDQYSLAKIAYEATSAALDRNDELKRLK